MQVAQPVRHISSTSDHNVPPQVLKRQLRPLFAICQKWDIKPRVNLKPKVLRTGADRQRGGHLKHPLVPGVPTQSAPGGAGAPGWVERPLPGPSPSGRPALQVKTSKIRFIDLTANQMS